MQKPQHGSILWMIDQIFEADLGEGLGAIVVILTLILIAANLMAWS